MKGLIFTQIMMKFKKAYNLEFLSLLVAVIFLCTSTGYGADLSNKDQLRKPLSMSTKNGKRRINLLLPNSSLEVELTKLIVDATPKKEKNKKSFRTFLLAGPIFELLGRPEGTLATTVYRIEGEGRLQVESEELSHDSQDFLSWLSEMGVWDREDEVIFVNASEIMQPDSEIDSDTKLEDALWHERIHFETDQLDEGILEQILYAIRNSDDELIGKVRDIVAGQGSDEVQLDYDAIEVLAYIAIIYKRIRTKRRAPENLL